MASKLNRIGKDIMSAMKKATEHGTSAYDTTAEVRRIEGDTAWVHIAGGVDETPVKLTIAAKAGDSVQVRVGGGRAWITGNATAPPTDDRQANIATEKAETAGKKVVIVQEIADTAKKIADTAKKIAGNTTQYFWHTESGIDTGAHITEKTQEEFLADPENGGGNLLARSNGMAVRDGLTELATFSGAGLSVNNSNGVQVANFTDEGSTIGRTDLVAHSWLVLTSKGMVIRYKSPSSAEGIIDLANIGYATKTLDTGGVRHIPQFTFGARLDDSGIGIDSVAEGYGVIASGNYSHAEGYYSEASGLRSHAQGDHTIAQGLNQTVIGRFNKAQGTMDYASAADPAFIIGNGSPQVRSNALTVDWWGNIVASGGLTLNGDEPVADWVTKQGTDNSWNYKKWHSGKYEAWRYYQANSLVITTASAGTYYGGEKNIPFPSFHQSLEACTYGNTISQSSGVYIYQAIEYGSNLRVQYRAHTSNSNASCGGFFYIHGTY